MFSLSDTEKMIWTMAFAVASFNDKMMLSPYECAVVAAHAVKKFKAIRGSEDSGHPTTNFVDACLLAMGVLR